VLIEVTIAEVRRSKELSTGSSFTLTRDGSRTTTSAELAGDDPGGLALRFLRAGTLGIDAALSALSARGEVRILSRPAVLAQNNQEARILIGSERPFVQVFRSLPTDAGVRDQIVQYRDVGTKLTITPTINGDRYVSLQVVQEVSTATAETQFGAPVISTREAATHLFVRDGQTAVLGGLIERQREQSRSGIPLLKDVPILGALFGSTKSVDLQSELYLFITPHVIVNDEDADRVREDVERKTDLIRDILPARPEAKPPADTLPAAQPAKPR
jgi:general secretion pathway protein D